MANRLPLYLDGTVHVPRELASGDTIDASFVSKTRQTVSITSTGASAGTVTMGKIVTLLNLTTNNPLRIRLYTTVANQVADQSRSVTINPPAGSGLQFEGVSNSSLLSFDLDSVTAFNNESTITSAIAYYIEPATGSSTTATFTFTVDE